MRNAFSKQTLFTNGSMKLKDSASEKNVSGTIAKEETANNSLSGLDQHSTWVGKPEDAQIFDDAFWVRKQRWGTYISVGPDGKEFVTALTEESCVSGTRFYLKGLQEGFPEESTSYNGTVGGKL